MVRRRRVRLACKKALRRIGLPSDAVSFFEGLVTGGPGEVATMEALRPWLSQGSLAIATALESN
jgi:hypothetical protein